MRERPLTLRWVLLNALLVTGLAVLAIEYGGRVHGASLLVVPVILAMYAFESFHGLRLCWRADQLPSELTVVAEKLLRETKDITFWAWNLQMTGILATIAGIWIIVTGTLDISTLGPRLLEGMGVALVGSFVGLLCSQALAAQHRWIERRLEG